VYEPRAHREIRKWTYGMPRTAREAGGKRGGVTAPIRAASARRVVACRMSRRRSSAAPDGLLTSRLSLLPLPAAPSRPEPRHQPPRLRSVSACRNSAAACCAVSASRRAASRSASACAIQVSFAAASASRLAMCASAAFWASWASMRTCSSSPACLPCPAFSSSTVACSVSVASWAAAPARFSAVRNCSPNSARCGGVQLSL
jgi:hypothetical protein